MSSANQRVRKDGVEFWRVCAPLRLKTEKAAIQRILQQLESIEGSKNFEDLNLEYFVFVVGSRRREDRSIELRADSKKTDIDEMMKR